jgi:hypothetical protein
MALSTLGDTNEKNTHTKFRLDAEHQFHRRIKVSTVGFVHEEIEFLKSYERVSS